VNQPPDPTTPRYPVRLVAQRSGLTPHVLRAWERRYQVVAPSRSEGGQRLYSQVDVERLTLLHRLTERGHAIGRLASLDLAALTRLEEESPAPARPSGSGVGDAEAALRAIGRLDHRELQATLERAAITLGVTEFLDGVVAPVLEEVGRGWKEGLVSVGQEHLATAVFRRVLSWLLGVYEVDDSAPRLVVATPPGQVHELGALMAAVSAAAEGWAVTYLGPDLPVADLLSAAAQTEARAVAVSVVYVPDDREVVAALRATRAGLPAHVPLLVGGAGASRIAAAGEPAGVVAIASLPGLRALLRRLGEEGAA
jgi:DNA-binding transcriptional MerR regulator/methylmalonyl-CoA mutase cobalamin-binding subunit